MDYALPIQIEFLDCGTARWSQPDEVQVIRRPREMLAPLVMTWMKKRDCAARGGIYRVGLIGFRPVASLAGEREVVFVVCATAAFRRDVFGRVQLCGAEFGADAVFAIALCPLSNQTPQFGGDTFLSHAARA